MKITTKQAAEKLEVTPSAVVQMIKAGRLADVSGNGNGKRHAYFLDLTEVNELRKTYRNAKANGHVAVQVPSPVPMLAREREREVREEGVWALTVPAGFVERLERIEQKLDRLLGMWS